MAALTGANPYAVGTNVYRGASSAATMGPVDPTGYIDRSVNNGSAVQPAQSYTPGVAAGALQTLRSDSPATAQQAQPMNAMAVAPATPTSSSTTGQIGYNIPIPYDLQLKGIEADSNYQNLLLQIKAQNDAAAMNETVGRRNLDIQEKDQTRTDINRAAYRGMVRSSGYVDQVDRTAQYINNMKTDIESKFFQALNDSQAQGVQGKSQYDAIMEAIQREAAQRLADKQATDPNAGPIDALPDPGSQGTPDPNPVNAGTPKDGVTPPDPTHRTVPTPPATGTAGTPGAPTKRTAPKPATTHVSVIKASKGDTLASLAKKHGMSLATLMKLNPGLKRPNGQWLVYAGSTIHLG